MVKRDEIQNNELTFFEKYLFLWVILCMFLGTLISIYIPSFEKILQQYEFAGISIPITILIWIMIYPVMMEIDFASIKNIGRKPKPFIITWFIDWLIKPFLMYFLGVIFLIILFKGIIPNNIAKEYLIGIVLLGAAPGTAMVFVWSHLAKGSPAYTFIQVATNDLIILVAFVPTVKFLLGVNDVTVPWTTLMMALVLFLIIPLIIGLITRVIVVSKKDSNYFKNEFLHKFKKVTAIGLLLTLIIVFSFQGSIIIKYPLDILLIAIPLIIQIIILFTITYLLCKILRVPRNIRSASGLISATTFFELSLAVGIALFGPNSPVVLGTSVGVLVEVPMMIILIKFIHKIDAKSRFKELKNN